MMMTMIMRSHLAGLIWLGCSALGCSTHADTQSLAAGSGAGLDAGPTGTKPIQNVAGSSAGAAANSSAAVSGRSGSAAGAGSGGSSDDWDAAALPAADSGEPASGRAGFIFSPYKDTSIDLNWNTNVITTKVSGEPLAITSDFAQNHGRALTLAFATGECGSETWGGVPGATLASANLPALEQAGISYVVSTGGAAGTFTCGSDAGMAAFLERWDSSGLIGIDFDIEAGQSQAVISDLIARTKAAHTDHPALRFSLTLATLATSEAGAQQRSFARQRCARQLEQLWRSDLERGEDRPWIQRRGHELAGLSDCQLDGDGLRRGQLYHLCSQRQQLSDGTVSDSSRLQPA
jgi:hypothetical protein